MSATVAAGHRPASLRSSWPASIAAALVSALLAALFTSGMLGAGPEKLMALGFAALAGGLTLYILRRGSVATPRILLFVGVTLLFSIVFELSHEVNRGSILLRAQQIAEAKTPICPLTIGFVVPPLLIRGVMIFPSTVAALQSAIVVWIGFALLLGRGWCSWLCFFGGIDQAFAALGPKRSGGRPLVQIPESWLRYLRLFPYALILFLALVAVATLYPIFCAWLCPLRIAYDPPEVVRSVQWLTAIVIVTLGMGILVVGPLLTRKRLFCSYGCPLLPFNSLLGFLSPFRVRVDRERCRDCGICVNRCPQTALTKESVAKGGTTLSCSRCGECIDACPRQAIDIRLVGSRAPGRAAFVALAVAFAVMFFASYLLVLVGYLQTGKVPPIGGS